MKIKSTRELEDNLHAVGVAVRILTRLESEKIDVQSLYTVSAQLSQVNNYVNQLIGAVTASRNVVSAHTAEEVKAVIAKSFNDVRDKLLIQDELEIRVAEDIRNSKVVKVPINPNLEKIKDQRNKQLKDIADLAKSMCPHIVGDGTTEAPK